VKPFVLLKGGAAVNFRHRERPFGKIKKGRIGRGQTRMGGKDPSNDPGESYKRWARTPQGHQFNHFRIRPSGEVKWSSVRTALGDFQHGEKLWGGGPSSSNQKRPRQKRNRCQVTKPTRLKKTPRGELNKK